MGAMVAHGVTVVLIGLHTVAEEGESGGEMDQGGPAGSVVRETPSEMNVKKRSWGLKLKERWCLAEAATVVGVEEAVCTAA